METAELVRADCLKLAAEIMGYEKAKLLDLDGEIEKKIISTFKLEGYANEYDDLRLLIGVIAMGKGQKVAINLKDGASEKPGEPKSLFRILTYLSKRLSEVERVMGHQELRANLEHMLLKQSKRRGRIGELPNFESSGQAAGKVTEWLEQLSTIRSTLDGFQKEARRGPAHKTYMEDIVRVIGDFWVQTLKREYSVGIENKIPQTETDAFIYCTFCLAHPQRTGEEIIAIERKAEDLRAVFRAHQTPLNASIERLDA